MRTFCNSQFGRVRPILLISLVVIVVVGGLLARHWAPRRVVERQHAALIDAIERRSAKRLERLLAADYRDQWDFDRAKAALALSDIGSQFFVLTVTPVESRMESDDGGGIVVRHRVEVQGQGSPIAFEIMRQANRLREPFEFRWSRESFWPWDWRLTGIVQPGLPDELYGYEPGDLRRMMGGEDP